MGGVFSTTKAFRDALETSNMGTPSKSSRHRVLNSDFDPRSPSNEVARTPIAVAATPSRITGDVIEMCTTPVSHAPPLASVDGLDPRSPSVGIIRTPLQLAPVSGDEVIDPRSPTVGITRTPIIADREPCIPEGSEVVIADNVALLADVRSDSVPNIDAIPPILELDLEDEVINRSLSEPDLTKDDVSLIRRRNVPFVSNSFRESTPKKKTKVNHQGLSHDDLSTKSIKVKDRSPLRVKDNQRSPLSLRNNVDMNSPRVIVQRKQMNKLTLSMKGPKIHMDSPKKCVPRSPSKYQALESTDKENMLEF